MKKALIDPNALAVYLMEWVKNPVTDNYDPVFKELTNSSRVADVADAEFPVAEPLFWIDCADDVVPDIWYYNNVTSEILLVPSPPRHPKQQTPDS